MNEYVKNELEQRIASFQQLPYLFVGTGFSMRYSHAPSWNELLFNTWRVINPEKKERSYEKLKQRIERKIAIEHPGMTEEEQKYYVNPVLATAIEQEFNERYYSEEGFDMIVFNEEENNHIINNRYNPFKFLVARQMSHMQLDNGLTEYKEVQNTLTWGRHSIMINEFILDNYEIVYQALSKIRSSMPIKLARKLQDMVCRFVYSTEAQNNILFGDINSPDIDDEKAAVYFGRADTVRQIGFSYFDIDEILEDILFDNKPYLINSQLIDKTFKNIRSRSGSTLLPIYKYIRALNYPLNNIPSNYNIINGYDDPDIRPTSSDMRSYIKTGTKFNNIRDIEMTYPNHIPKQVANIKKFAKDILTEELGEYLRKYYNTELYERYKSLFRKLIALYDYKKYS